MCKALLGVDFKKSLVYCFALFKLTHTISQFVYLHPYLPKWCSPQGPQHCPSSVPCEDVDQLPPGGLLRIWFTDLFWENSLSVSIKKDEYQVYVTCNKEVSAAQEY